MRPSALDHGFIGDDVERDRPPVRRRHPAGGEKPDRHTPQAEDGDGRPIGVVGRDAPRDTGLEEPELEPEPEPDLELEPLDLAVDFEVDLDFGFESERETNFFAVSLTKSTTSGALSVTNSWAVCTCDWTPGLFQNDSQPRLICS